MSHQRHHHLPPRRRRGRGAARRDDRAGRPPPRRRDPVLRAHLLGSQFAADCDLPEDWDLVRRVPSPRAAASALRSGRSLRVSSAKGWHGIPCRPSEAMSSVLGRGQPLSTKEGVSTKFAERPASVPARNHARSLHSAQTGIVDKDRRYSGRAREPRR